jgi:hypothetical protein
MALRALALAMVLGAVVTAQPSARVLAVSAAQQHGQSHAVPFTPEREQRLRARVAAWHEARIVRDQRRMYDLLEPDYRARVDYGAYTQQTALRLRFPLLKYEIAEVRPLPDDRASVLVNLRMDLGRFGENVLPATDAWVWRDGDWWLVFKEIELPFPR